MIEPTSLTEETLAEELPHFNHLEEQILSEALEAGRHRLKDFLEGLDAQLPAECPHCGSSSTEAKGKDHRVLLTKLGRIVFERRRLFCRGCGKSSYPLDE